LLVSILETDREDEYLFDWVNLADISYGLRDKSEDFAGTTQAIWAIVAGVYLALMGPQGMRELGETVLARTQYAIGELSKIKGVKGSRFDAPNFKEFVVNFDGTGKTVADVNSALLHCGIFGGIDLSLAFPELGASGLYCVTEKHRKADIDRLVSAIAEAVQ
jgi:glycine dehydrogenase subunit 1